MGTTESAGKEKTSPRPGAGGFRRTDIGPLLHPKSSKDQVKAAAAKLRGLFAEHHSVAAVAREMGVDRSSVERWLKRIIAAGFKDPRGTTKTAA